MKKKLQSNLSDLLTNRGALDKFKRKIAKAQETKKIPKANQEHLVDESDPKFLRKVNAYHHKISPD